MKVLLTGGGGYIGSVLARMLVERGHGVRVMDRLFFGIDSLNEISDRIDIVRDDVRWADTSVLNDIDAIVDMAALSNDPAGELDRLKTLDINYLGRVRMAKLAKEAGVKKYVLASSCSVYGFQPGVLNEKSNVNPLTTYAKANILWENDTLPLNDRGFTVTALRQATVYGLSPKMRFDLAVNGMVLGFFKNRKIPIMRDGSQIRPFVHVRDTSSAFISVLEADADVVGGQIFNVGSNEQNYKIMDLAKLVAESIGVPFEYEWYGALDTRSYNVSFEKIGGALKFKPRFTPKEGSKEIYDALNLGKLSTDDMRHRTVEWYKNLMAKPELSKDVQMNGRVL